MYPDRESFYQHARFVLVGKDKWTQRAIPQREELERLYQTFQNAKAAEGVAIGRWRDTSHTGTAAALDLLTEYTPGGILDTEVWGQSFNDAFLLGVIKAARPVELFTVLTTCSCGQCCAWQIRVLMFVAKLYHVPSFASHLVSKISL